MNKKWNKFDAIYHVLASTLSAQDKTMLTELILRSSPDGFCFPSVESLCRSRGIKHEKNFQGVGTYMPELVRVTKRGRMNGYWLQHDAIMALPRAEVVIKHTPALGPDLPAREDEDPHAADNTPAGADISPGEEGAKSKEETTRDSTVESSGVSADASTPSTSCLPSSSLSSSSVSDLPSEVDHPGSSMKDAGINDTPAGADLTEETIASIDDWDDIDWGIDGYGQPNAARTALGAIETAEVFQQVHENQKQFNEPQGNAQGIRASGRFDWGNAGSASRDRSIEERFAKNPNWLNEDW